MARLRKLNKAQFGAMAWAALLIFVIVVYLGASSSMVAGLQQKLQNLTAWPKNGTLTKQDTNSAKLQNLQNQLDDLSQSSKLTDGWLNARIVGRINNSRQMLLINKGKLEGINQQMSVVANGFLVGRVWHVEPHKSTILLVGDPDLSVAVVVPKTGNDGLLEAKSGGVVFDHVLKSKVNLSNQPLVTSGEGNLAPAGLPIGKITNKISQDSLGENTWGADYPSISGVSLVKVGGV